MVLRGAGGNGGGQTETVINMTGELGMDTLVRNGQPQTWISAGSLINTDRVIAAIEGNRITLAVPLTDNYDSYGTPVTPASLYLQQLCERRGPDAVAKIGYGGSCEPASAPR